MSLSKEEKKLQIMEEITVVLLIGKTGSGKSTTGNIIFNEAVFQSRKSTTSVTRVCQKHTAVVNNKRVKVIDTPDFIYSTHTDFDSDSELKRAVELCAPGAHVILLILPLSTFTEQENDFIGWFKQIFGAEAFRFTLVLFTHADITPMPSLREMIRRNTPLSDFINQCGQRYHEFNIVEQMSRQQVTDLMEKIDRMVSENRHTSYTLEMMEETEMRRKEKETRAEEERKREHERKEREHQMKLERVREETETRVRRDFEQKMEKLEKERREEEERSELEHKMKLERVREETEIHVKRDLEEEILEKQRKAEKREKDIKLKQIKLKYVCVIMCFAVVSGGGLMWKEGSLNRWIFIKGFIAGGSAAASGVFTGIFWRLMWKSQFICSSSHGRPSAVRQLLLKTAGVTCGLAAGIAIGHFVGNVHPVMAGLAGATGAFTAI